MRRFTMAVSALLAFTPAAFAADAPPADWVEVAAGPMFTVKAPPGTTFAEVKQTVEKDGKWASALTPPLPPVTAPGPT